MYFETEKHLPIVHDFCKEKGEMIISHCDKPDEIKIIDPETILTYVELDKYLLGNKYPGKINHVVVE